MSSAVLDRFASRALLSSLGLLVAASPLVAQPRDIETWTTGKSEHFEVHSNAVPERVAEIVAGLERFRALFANLAPELELQSPAPIHIFAFHDAVAYAPYKTGDEGGGVVLGQFWSHPDGNYITLNADPSYIGSFSVIYHEYVHYLVQSNFPSVPRWFNEGLAEYYSSFLADEERVYLGHPVDRHLRWLQRNRELEVESVLGVTRDSSLEHDANGAGRFYAVSWILVHYLLSDESDLSDELARYFTALAKGEDAHGAFVDAFGFRPAELEDAIRTYLSSGPLPVAAISLEGLPTPDSVETYAAHADEVLIGLADLLAHMGRETEAARHAHQALTFEPESGDAYAVLAYVRDRQGRREEAHELWEQARRWVPLRAGSYLFEGRHYMALANGGGLTGDGSDVEPLAEEARRAFVTATQIDGSYGEAWAMLGISHLLSGGDPGEGIRSLERARALQPGRTDLLLHLVQLYVRDDRDDLAQAIVDGPLSRMGTPRMVALAREEIERGQLVRSANEALREGDLETGIALFDRAISVTSDPGLRMRMEESLVELRARSEDGERQ